MNILSIESVLTAESDAPAAEELSERIDAMHDVLTSDSSVLSADILTTGGEEIHFLVRIVSLEDEDEEATQTRADQLIDQAIAAAHIKTQDAGSLNAAVTKKAFALA